MAKLDGEESDDTGDSHTDIDNFSLASRQSGDVYNI